MIRKVWGGVRVSVARGRSEPSDLRSGTTYGTRTLPTLSAGEEVPCKGKRKEATFEYRCQMW